jgi:hypothetical protein
MTLRPMARRLLAAVCVVGTPFANTGSTEWGQFVETQLRGAPRHDGRWSHQAPTSI